MKTAILWLIACMLVSAPLSAQDTALPEAEQPGWDVFIRNDEDDAATELVFINILTGEMNSASIAGERFTLLGNAVIYYDLDEEQVKQVAPDTSIRDHPFVTRPADTERVDWVLSRDGGTIAWTATRRGDGGTLSTSTYVSALDGVDSREILLDGPRDGVRVLPVAFSGAANELIMEAHPDGISKRFSYTQYAGLFALDLVDGAVRQLPDESGCYCAAAFGDRVFLRFPPSESADGVAVQVYSFDGSQKMALESAAPAGFTSPGEALVSADDNLALYIVSQVPAQGSATDETRSVFVLVDLQTLEQSLVSHPITGLARGVAWTEDHGAVLFTNDQQLGAWKLRLSDGKISEVASALYLGSLQG
ncbi:MAG: hypothetical protein OXN94_05495 [Chloroflexota bacterium]|nr:hypothetical protein [Chloroflexota bacterium]MDE2951855.1 hypothetical protein [Chloroflexota bacterium]